MTVSTQLSAHCKPGDLDVGVLTFCHWCVQVRVEGKVEHVGAAESDAYFHR